MKFGLGSGIPYFSPRHSRSQGGSARRVSTSVFSKSFYLNLHEIDPFLKVSLSKEALLERIDFKT